jgi:osmotically-inducible protein OsmY
VIADAVKARLAANPALKALNIVMYTHDGVVTLRGDVNSVEQRKAAEVETRAVRGVKGVINQLLVRQ